MFDWNGHRLGSNSIFRFAVSESHTTCSDGPITTISGITPTRTSFSAIASRPSGRFAKITQRTARALEECVHEIEASGQRRGMRNRFEKAVTIGGSKTILGVARAQEIEQTRTRAGLVFEERNPARVVFRATMPTGVNFAARFASFRQHAA